MAREVHRQQQCHKTMYDRNAFVSRHKQRGVSIIPQTVTAIRSSSTHTSTAVGLHHSMQHLSISPPKVDYVFQMLQTSINHRLPVNVSHESKSYVLHKTPQF